MRKLKHLLIILLIISACQKDDIVVAPENIHVISSAFTKQDYELKVILPDGYNSNNSYPVVYLLDGYYHFNDVKKNFKENRSLREVILVGIFYEKYPFSLSNLGTIEELREVDFTYPIHTTSEGTDLGGGGLDFYEFLKQELLPLIEQNYSTDDNDRTLMGHSLGGYFCLFQMMHFRANPLFQNVIALSPSLWWSQLEILEMEQAIKSADEDLPFSLYIGIGEQEGVEANTLVDELNERLIAHSYPSLSYLVERYQGGHLHSAKTGFDSGLKFIYQ